MPYALGWGEGRPANSVAGMGLEQVCCLMLGDPQHAEDAMQEAVLTAWRERGLAPASSSVRMWVYRIAVRVCSEALGDPAMSFSADERLTR